MNSGRLTDIRWGKTRSTSRLRKNNVGTLELRWSARVAQQESTPARYRHETRETGGKGETTEVRGPKFEVFGTSNPELRTPDLACRAKFAHPAFEKLSGF